MCQDVLDQRLPNRREPNVPVSYEELRDLGILHWKLDPATMLKESTTTTSTTVDPHTGDTTTTTQTSPSMVDKICRQMHYQNRDEVKCSPGHLPNYEERLKMFFTEHIHEDEEIRLIVEGSGYFDVRNVSDEWVRIHVTPGDFLVLPAGIYHRFTMDAADYTHAMRFFKEVPKWTPVNRPCDDNKYRLDYQKDIGAASHGVVTRETILGPTQLLPERLSRMSAPTAAMSPLNVYVHYPETFDDTVRSIVLRSDAVKVRDVVVFYFTGAHNPTTKQSWCPDCVAADQVVHRAITESRTKGAEDGRTVHFVQLGILRSSYKDNPAFLYRTHPFSHIRCIPTLVVAIATATSDVEEEAAAGKQREGSTHVGATGIEEVWRQDDVITDAWRQVVGL